jgi:ssDNA-binding Zn-finger/Zn-ribbon topoisomerase 1
MLAFPIIRTFILLSLTPWIKAIPFECGNEIPMERGFMSAKLFIWCSQDPKCSEMYYQTKGNNVTVFNYMTSNMLNGYNSLDQLPNNILCGSVDSSDVVRNLWLMKLSNSKSHEITSCPTNHELVVDHEQLTAHCVCSHNRQCSVDTSKQDILAIELILMIIILFAILVLQLFRIIDELKPVKGQKIAIKVLEEIY